jgi:hypothetical protein
MGPSLHQAAMIEEIFISYPGVTRNLSPARIRSGCAGGRRVVRPVHDPGWQNWHDEILEGIRSAKPLYWSSHPMQWNPLCARELNKALNLARRSFRSFVPPDGQMSLHHVKDIQTINLHSGSYTDNLIDWWMDSLRRAL